MSDRTATRRADFEGKAREAAPLAAPKASGPKLSAPKRRNGHDARLFRIAAAVEKALAS